MNTALCLLFLAAAETQVEREQPAYDYAHGSVSVIGSASLGVGLFGSSQAGTRFEAFVLTSGVAVRVTTKVGFTFEPRIGVDGLLATGDAGLYAVFAARAGLGVGWAFRLTDRLALTPMLAYEASYLGGGLALNLSGLAHSGAVELPLTVFFSKDSFIEVYARGGVTSMLGQASPIMAAGWRFGRVW